MREALGSMDWDFNTDCSTDTIWENFVDILNGNIEKYVPRCFRTYSYKKPWMNRETTEIIDKKRRSWIKLRNCTSDTNISVDKRSRNEATCTKSIRKEDLL